MDYLKLLEQRRSCRAFLDKPVSDADLEKIIAAANGAPVGSARYMDLHLAVVRDKKALAELQLAAHRRLTSMRAGELEEIVEKVEGQNADDMPKDLFYNAPAVIFVSHRKQELQPGIEWCNVTSVVTSMHLEATALGLGSCFMWFAMESSRMLPEYDRTAMFNAPEGFVPLLGLAVGYPAQESQPRTIKTDRISTTWVNSL